MRLCDVRPASGSPPRRTMGVIRPPSIATATAMSAWWCRAMPSAVYAGVGLRNRFERRSAGLDDEVVDADLDARCSSAALMRSRASSSRRSPGRWSAESAARRGSCRSAGARRSAHAVQRHEVVGAVRRCRAAPGTWREARCGAGADGAGRSGAAGRDRRGAGLLPRRRPRDDAAVRTGALEGAKVEPLLLACREPAAREHAALRRGRPDGGRRLSRRGDGPAAAGGRAQRWAAALAVGFGAALASSAGAVGGWRGIGGQRRRRLVGGRGRRGARPPRRRPSAGRWAR